MDNLAGRLWSRVKRGTGCWEWQAGKTSAGYGEFMFRRKMYYAHRAAWQVTRGSIPKGQCVRHRCDNPACCRPDHLELGFQADNVQDMIERGRDRKALGEENGRSKLNADKVRRVRVLRCRGFSYSEIGRDVGVHKDTVRAVLKGRTWKHV